jgi:hypothetical protein
MIVKWLGLHWYFGPPEDEKEDCFPRWLCFALQCTAIAVLAMLWVKYMAAELETASNPLIHYEDVEPSTPQVD